MPTKRRRFAERRKALGFTQETLAEALGVERSTVVRWELGGTDPQPYIRPKLARILEVSTRELMTLLRTPATTPAGTVSLPAPSELEVIDSDMNRRELLQLLSIAGALVAVPQLDGAERHVMPESIDELEQMNSHLWQAFALSQSKRAVYPLVRQQLGLLTAALERNQGIATHEKLCALAGDLFQLAGEVFFDSNRLVDAGHCYTLAASASKEAKAFDLWACALTRHAFVAMSEQHFTQTLPLLNVASSLAKRGDNQLSTRYWVAQVRAQALAGAGDFDGCSRALDEAETVSAMTGAFQNGGWLRFDDSRLAEERGRCYIELGHPDRAESALIAALSQKLSARRRGSVLVDLAVLGMQRNDVGQTAHYGSAALELADATGSGYIGRKLHALNNQLTPLVTDSQIHDLSEAISAFPVAGR
ncbi:hypothetical protein GCM10009839_85640 [Catenulispora yoronensis]|uniref:HTH cro/C1-type domain-containing protein n=1 Tax=Catenulispora yoronensis TaxID=450799 RepID=A0ABN2VG03_9ACTN